MHSTSSLDPQKIQAIITQLDAVLAELDKANLGFPAIDIASAILKLERLAQPAPVVRNQGLRSTA